MRSVSLLLSALSVAILFALPRDLRAQNGDAAATSTKQGVYNREQALRGEDIYAGNCRSCHTPESHTGALFNARWNGRALFELYRYLRDAMPKSDPGSLAPEEYADVVAYLLRVNRMPLGDAELPADSLVLNSIRIETTKSP